MIEKKKYETPWMGPALKRDIIGETATEILRARREGRQPDEGLAEQFRVEIRRRQQVRNEAFQRAFLERLAEDK